MFAQHTTFVCFYQGGKMKCKCKRKEELPAEAQQIKMSLPSLFCGIQVIFGRLQQSVQS